MHYVVKWPNILLKYCSVNTERFLKYVWPFYNITHERININKNCNYSCISKIDVLNLRLFLINSSGKIPFRKVTIKKLGNLLENKIIHSYSFFKEFVIKVKNSCFFLKVVRCFWWTLMFVLNTCLGCFIVYFITTCPDQPWQCPYDSWQWTTNFW